MTECVIYLHAIGSLTGHSPLMDKAKWTSSTAFTVIKKRPYDIERCEVELSYNYLADYDYAYIEYNGTPAPAAAIIPCVYRITDIRQGDSIKTIAGSGFTDRINGSAVLTLELDALATWYVNRGGGLPTIFGRWSRLPMRAVVEPFQVRPAQMIRSSTVNLPRMTETVKVYRTGGSDPQGPFPIVFVKITGLISQVLTNLYFVVPVDDGLVGPQTSGLHRENSVNAYPSLFQIMNFTGQITGMNTSEIIDVSVSQYCPFEYTVGTDTGYQSNYVSLSGVDTWSHSYTVTWNGTSYSGVAYGYIDRTPVGSSKSETVTTMVTAEEPGICQIAIKNAEGNIVQSIDPRFAEWDAVNSVWILTMTYTCYVTTSAIMSKLTLSDGSIIEWSEGHLPYNSSRWNDYVLSERNYDREMNMIQRDKAQYDLVTGAISSLANGAFAAAFSKGAGAGMAGLSMIGAAFDYQGQEMVREREQSAKEGLMKAAPNTVYSDAYGIGYLIKMLAGEHAAVVMMTPQGISSTDITDYINVHGYPVSDLPLALTSTHLITANRGFVQATQVLTADIGGKTGVFFRALDKQLRSGTLFKVIT